VRNPYAALLRVRGGPAFSAAAFVGRLPISMGGIAIVLLVSASTHRYGLAGAVSAVTALAEALGQPVLSRYVDRYGQWRAVPPMVLGCVAGLGAMTWAATSGAAAWTLFLSGALAGACWPNLGAFVRARWSHALGGRPELQTAYSLESVLDEVIFVLGPPLVTWVAVAVGPPEAIATMAGLLVVGCGLFVVQRSTEPPPVPRDAHAGRPALSVPGVRVLVVVMVALGGVFGCFEVVTVAISVQQGHPGAAGVILALNAAGSMVAGLVWGALRLSTPLDRLLLVLALVVPLTVVAFPFVSSLVVLGVVGFLAGFVISPTLITTFRLMEVMSPPGRLTEGLTLASTGIVLGVSVAAAVSGRLVDTIGTPQAYVVTTVSGMLTALTALLGAPVLRAGVATSTSPATAPPAA
jgi:MFS family permease